MLVLNLVVPAELMDKDQAIHVIRLLQTLDEPAAEKQRLMKEWTARVGYPLREWMLKAVALHPGPVEV